MTYEEYKNNKNPKEHKIIKVILNKLFTIIIFTMIIVIISNLSPKFREFVYNNVLNNSLDFSFVNKILEKTSNVFKEEQTKQVFNEIKEYEPYKEGIKYKIKENENIYLKDSGIVTYIGEKEGYNNTVIIQQSNGYYAWYGNIKENVKLYDYVESGTQIGTASNEYYYVLLKDDKPVSIHD